MGSLFRLGFDIEHFHILFFFFFNPIFFYFFFVICCYRVICCLFVVIVVRFFGGVFLVFVLYICKQETYIPQCIMCV